MKPTNIRRLIFLAVLCLALASLSILSCGKGSESKKTAKPKIDYRPRVVLVSIDSLRSDFLGCYGNAIIHTPNLDRFSRSASVFSNARTTAPYTVPALSAIMTGLLPRMHNARNIMQLKDGGGIEQVDVPLSADADTLAFRVAGKGYSTFAVVGGFTVSASFSGLQRGFNNYDDTFKGTLRPASEVTARALTYVKAAGDKAFFGWLHYFDAHFPYGNRKIADGAEYARYVSKTYGASVPTALKKVIGTNAGKNSLSVLVHRYAASIERIDRQVGDFLRGVRQAVGKGKLVIVVTADHGESFTANGHLFTHGDYLDDVVLRVPLMIFASVMKSRGRIFHTPVSTLDIRATIEDFLGTSRAHKAYTSTSIRPLLKGMQRPMTPLIAESKAYASDSQAMRRMAIIDWPWKLAVADESSLNAESLYNLEADPAERNNLLKSQADSARADELSTTLQKILQETKVEKKEAAPVTTHDDDTKDKLKSLGYLGE